MKCPHCGFTGSDEASSCRKCGRDLAEARRTLGLEATRRPPRATTPILEGPVDPSLVDDAPPAPDGPASSSILDLETASRDVPEGVSGGRAGEQADPGEVLADIDPVEAADITSAHDPRSSGSRAAARVTARPKLPAPAAPAGPAGGVIDLGEPIEIDEPPAPLPPSLAGVGDWPEDEWEGVEGDLRSTTDPRALPKGGFWLRVVASMADSLLIQIVSSMAVFIVGTMSGGMAALASRLPAPGADPAESAEAFERMILLLLKGPLGWTFVALVTLASLYRPVCHWRWGKTPGKKLVGLRVVTARGENPGFVRACWRDIAYLLASLPFGLGLLWVVWDPQKQGWHDKLAGTYVLKEST